MNAPELVVSVPGMTCSHCQAAISEELVKVKGVVGVSVDLATKLVTVLGTQDQTAVTQAIENAGFSSAGVQSGK